MGVAGSMSVRVRVSVWGRESVGVAVGGRQGEGVTGLTVEEHDGGGSLWLQEDGGTS